MRNPTDRKVTTPTAKPRTRLDAAQLRDVAVPAKCDPRTVAKYVAHENVAPLTRRRIEAALRDSEHAHLIWTPTETPPQTSDTKR
jgi:hypothetical protein